MFFFTYFEKNHAEIAFLVTVNPYAITQAIVELENDEDGDPREFDEQVEEQTADSLYESSNLNFELYKLIINN